MPTAIFTHDACLRHDMGYGHPERPERLRAVVAALEETEFSELVWHQAPLVEREQLLRVHPEAHIDRIERTAPERGLAQIDGDTAMSPGSLEAARRAAGAVCTAVDLVVDGGTTNAFCAVRPPGHHAEPAQAMGFCFFNNVAVAAEHARAKHGFERVAVVDFDVHHGNGSQAAFEAEPAVMFVSAHQSPLYPGTGRATERGAGNICNIELPPGAGSAPFRQAFERILLPALRAFDPEFLFISAGFDAHRDDPLAQMELLADDYGWVTSELAALAAQHCDGRIVSTLEGGYDLQALADSVTAHVRALQAA